MNKIIISTLFLLIFFKISYSQKRIKSLDPIKPIDEYSKSEFADKVDTDANGRLKNGLKYRDVQDDINERHGLWVYKSKTDIFSGKTTRMAIKDADDKYIYENSNAEIATVVLSILENQVVYLTLSNTEDLFGEEGSIYFKFDNDPTKIYTFISPVSGNNNYIKIKVDPSFFKKIGSRKVLLVRVPIFRHGGKDIRFNLTGYKAD